MNDFLFIFGIALALFFAFMSGFRDGGNLVAANVFSRSIAPQRALQLACAGQLLGPFVLGSAVAATLGKEIFPLSPVEGPPVLLCLCAAFVSTTTWSLLTGWAGLPAGATHSLMGGLMGGFLGAFGPSGVNWSMGLVKVFAVLLLVPAAAFILPVLITGFWKRRLPGRAEEHSKGQWLTLFVLSAGQGANNGHKAAALITMMLLASGSLSSFKAPLWSIFCAAGALTLGVFIGASKIIKIFGKRAFRITPAQSLLSQGSAGALVLAAGLLGCPVSTNQIVKSSLVGASPAERETDPGRLVLKDILAAWLINFPGAGMTAALLYWTAAGALGYGMGSFERIMEFMGQ